MTSLDLKGIARFFRTHAAAFALAVAFGALTAFPVAHAAWDAGGVFNARIVPETSDDESFYIGRIRDVLEGNAFLNNSALAEFKGGAPQQLFLAEFLLAQPLRLAHVTAAGGRVVYAFALPIIALLLAYGLLLTVTKSRAWAVAFAALLFFGAYPTAFARPVSPQFNFLFWLSLMWIAWRGVEGGFTKRIVAAAAVNFGLLFYIYPYYWTFFGAFFVLLALVPLLVGRRSEFLPNAYRIAAILIGGAVLAIPYFWYTFRSLALPEYQETLARLGLVSTHFPSGASIVRLALIVGLAYAWAWRTKRIRWDVASATACVGVVAVVIAVNQHVVTGRNLEFSSHFSMISTFVAAVAAAFLVARMERGPRWFPYACAFSIVLVALAGTVKAVRAACQLDGFNASVLRYAPVVSGFRNMRPPKRSSTRIRPSPRTSRRIRRKTRSILGSRTSTSCRMPKSWIGGY